ncbi:MAG: alginate lyase family protein, partial [Candidatus Cryptobacteroides sp.]
MKKVLLAIAVIAFCSCSGNLSQGTVDLDDEDIKKDELHIPETFVHPGIMSTMSDIERWREIYSTQEQPAFKSYELLSNDYHSFPTYTMIGPFTEIYRGNDNGTRPSIQGKYESDFNAAYQNALMYAVTQKEEHAVKAVEILLAYANNLRAIVATDQPLLAGIMGVKFMYAAELMRYLYPQGMTDGNFAKVCGMFKNIFVPVLEKFLSDQPYANGNWGASVVMSYIAAAVLFDDIEMYKKGINFYVMGNDNGTIINYVDGETGQCQESGRDQAHSQLGLACLSVSCEIAWKQGTDLYGVKDNRLLKGFEYTARYNAGHNDLPFKQWTDV